MPRTRPRLLTVLFALTTLVVSFALHLGCSSDSLKMTGPDVNTDLTTALAQQNEIASPGETPQTAPLSSLLNGTTSLVTRLILAPCGVDSGRIIAKKGGTIELRCGGTTTGRFTVPANAITRDTTIVVRTSGLSIAGLAIREYDFSPDGLKFRTPATLEFNVADLRDGNGIIPSVLLWLYYNPLTQRWELDEILKPNKDGIIRVQVDHFSKYRVTSNNVGLSQGGQN